MFPRATRSAPARHQSARRENTAGKTAGSVCDPGIRRGVSHVVRSFPTFRGASIGGFIPAFRYEALRVADLIHGFSGAPRDHRPFPGTIERAELIPESPPTYYYLYLSNLIGKE